VEHYTSLNPIDQVIITNGEFIEKEIMTGKHPVLFIGSQHVPQQTMEYLKSSNFEVAVLIGNELIESASAIRKDTGLSTFVKFARTSRSPQGTISPVEGLDTFYLPTYILKLTPLTFHYNSKTRLMELTLRNEGDFPLYLIGSYTIEEGSALVTFGDEEPVFIDRQQERTLTYPLQTLPEGDLEVKAFIVYGESRHSLERDIDETYPIERIEIIDRSQLTISTVSYQPSRQQMIIEIKNIGEVDTYATVEVIDVQILYTPQSFSSPSVKNLKPGEIKEFIVSVPMEEEDLKDNPYISVRSLYGERKSSLVNIAKQEFPFTIRETSMLEPSSAGMDTPRTPNPVLPPQKKMPALQKTKPSP
jgi:hypothetical protein